MAPITTTAMETLQFVLGIVQFLVLAHFIMSWLVNFQVLNIRQPLVAQVWYGLQRILEPLYAPIRRLLPNMGGIDLSPMIVLIIIFALQRLIANSMYSFG